MSLADQIIETGPVPAGETFTVHCTPQEINELRDELIGARRGGRVSPDDMQRFEIEAQEWRGSLGLTMRCERCGWVAALESPLLTLAELVQRADEHTEVCR